MHPWNKIIWGKAEEGNTTNCLMCLKRIPMHVNGNEVTSKFTKHMEKFHSATCSVQKLAKLCKNVEEKESRKGILDLDDLISEEKEWQQTFDGRSGSFRKFWRKCEEPGSGEDEPYSIQCFLCRGAWTGRNVKGLEKHLEDDHKVFFKVKELIELSKNQTIKTKNLECKRIKAMGVVNMQETNMHKSSNEDQITYL